MMREKLIELINSGRMLHTVCSSRGNSVTTFESRMVDEGVVELLADHLIANGVTVQEWIPVSERLPENDYGKHWRDRKYYLVRVNPSELMYVAHYGYKEHDWWIDEHDCVLSATSFKEVTHWMPLPEPPKGE